MKFFHFKFLSFARKSDIFYTLFWTLPLNLRNLKRNDIKKFYFQKAFIRQNVIAIIVIRCLLRQFVYKMYFCLFKHLKKIVPPSEETLLVKQIFEKKKSFSWMFFLLRGAEKSFAFEKQNIGHGLCSLYSLSFQNKCLSVSAPRKQFW